MRVRMLAGLAAVAVGLCGAGLAHDEKAGMKAAVHPPDKLAWADGPPSLPAGAKLAR